jgi:biotin-dependent carboxylase-like uncharacterized protein
MIEVVSPGWLAVIVDGGRHGLADVGVPPSSALDGFAFRTLNSLLGNPGGRPALEVMGSDFRLLFREDMGCAITGAKVSAFLDDLPLKPWSAFQAPKGSLLRVREVTEGLRYYVGFTGLMEADEVMGSYTTNIECRFGGYRGRPLMKGDRIGIVEGRPGIEASSAPAGPIPSMAPPHVLRIVPGPEWGSFCDAPAESVNGQGKEPTWFTVSARLNRTGIRLEGDPILFKEKADRSIVSEGVLPGTVQVPGDGMPIIVLYERTIGGYARMGIVAAVDRDRLAHLRPKDPVAFRVIGRDEAERLGRIGSGERPCGLPE